jgi:hypothetical protein
VTDVWGIYKNAQLIADQFAEAGYYTVIPDVFKKDPYNPENGSLDEWRKGHTTREIDPIVEKTIAWLKKEGYEKIGAVGYCFGAKVRLRFCSSFLTIAYILTHISVCHSFSGCWKSRRWLRRSSIIRRRVGTLCDQRSSRDRCGRNGWHFYGRTPS